MLRSEHVEEVARGLGLVAVYLFGSQATGSARPDSDVDVGILCPFGWDVQRREEGAGLVAETVARALTLPEDRIDVQDLRDAPALFRARVVRTGRVIFAGDPTDLARFQAASICEAEDVEYFLRPIRAAMRKRIAERRFAS